MTLREALEFAFNSVESHYIKLEVNHADSDDWEKPLDLSNYVKTMEILSELIDNPQALEILQDLVKNSQIL